VAGTPEAGDLDEMLGGARQRAKQDAGPGGPEMGHVAVSPGGQEAGVGTVEAATRFGNGPGG
jgi:hypothetical protein